MAFIKPRNLCLVTFAALAGAVVMAGWVRARQMAEPDNKLPLVIQVGAGARAPLRAIGDPYSTFSGISMDVKSDELVVTDENRTSILTYATQFQGTDRVMEPRRELRGLASRVGRTCSVVISPEHRELYFVNKDIEDNMVVFPVAATGDVAPLRELNIDHGAWGVSLDGKNDEVAITIQHINKVSVFSRSAKGNEPELRYLQGPKTGLASPQGIYVDGEHDEIFVVNHGNWRRTEPGEGRRMRDAAPLLAPSTGRYLPPSITVHSRTASGDAAPLRTIQGPKTRLNWPAGIYLDTASGQLAVANSADSSILFFDRRAEGDASPVRIIQGPATGLANPINLFVDPIRNEIWATNYEDHSITVYPRSAQGNVAPLRALRSAPKGTPSSGLGGSNWIAYDPTRKQILVPN